ncbi:MAG: winged helix DNA-binding domain-containing protein [Chloroflexi bacterium]|nr:winged helix DNA-binding domain-containing protein [Chloroflexota bacterium]MBU1746857.1 winged helix DNA-binding domain-containing protein [Chloroflexota bacterium]
MIVLDAQRLTAWRDRRYRRRPDLKVQTEAEARVFVDEVGLCLLFPVQGIELPSLWTAINGRERPVPQPHDDRELGYTWHWKDSLPTRKEIYYGKVLRKKATLLSLEILPYLYALSGNLGDLEEDVRAPYEAGQLTDEARRVYEALLRGGAMNTNELRRASVLEGKENAGRFDRTLVELQAGLKIAKVGISDANRWRYCYVYDLLPRALPDQVAAARHITEREALRTVLARYLETVGAATPAAVNRLLGWRPEDMTWAADALQREGRIATGAHVAGVKGEHLVWSTLLAQSSDGVEDA